jgi:hypothetical protein
MFKLSANSMLKDKVFRSTSRLNSRSNDAPEDAKLRNYATANGRLEPSGKTALGPCCVKIRGSDPTQGILLPEQLDDDTGRKLSMPRWTLFSVVFQMPYLSRLPLPCSALVYLASPYRVASRLKAKMHN